MSGAHEGGIFSLCVQKDGTLVSGGGKDRKVVLWGYDYRKQSEMEVRWGPDLRVSDPREEHLDVVWQLDFCV